MSSFWTGFLEGATRHIEEKRKSDKERALEILKGVISGDIESMPEISEAQGMGTTSQQPLITGPRRPRNIGEIIKSGFGITPQQGYRRRTTTIPEVSPSEKLTKTYDEFGRPKGFTIAPTTEKPTLWDIQKEARTTVNAMINQNPTLQIQVFDNPELITNLVDREVARLKKIYISEETKLSPMPSETTPTLPSLPSTPEIAPLSQPAIPKPTEERISVISLQGKRGTIPKSQLQDALKQGYRKINR